MLTRLLLFLFISSSIYAQQETLLSKMKEYRELDIKYKEQNDRVNWHYDRASDYGFSKIDRDHYDLVFRYWDDTTLIELKQKDSILEAYIYNFLIGLDYRSEERVYLKKNILNSIDTRLIMHHIETSKLKEIPSDKYITKWRRNFHYGPTYHIELYDKDGYFFNNYTAIFEQNAFYESLYIKRFIEKLRILANFKPYRTSFFENNPFSCYHYNQSYAVCKKLTRKQWSRIKKNQKRLGY